MVAFVWLLRKVPRSKFGNPYRGKTVFRQSQKWVVEMEVILVHHAKCVPRLNLPL